LKRRKFGVASTAIPRTEKTKPQFQPSIPTVTQTHAIARIESLGDKRAAFSKNPVVPPIAHASERISSEEDPR
jgi:hypothetical protein